MRLCAAAKSSIIKGLPHRVLVILVLGFTAGRDSIQMDVPPSASNFVAYFERLVSGDLHRPAVIAEYRSIRKLQRVRHIAAGDGEAARFCGRQSSGDQRLHDCIGRGGRGHQSDAVRLLR